MKFAQLFCVGVMLVHPFAHAASDCPSIKDDKARLDCYDKQYGQTTPPQSSTPARPASEQNERSSSGFSSKSPEWLSSFQLREDGNVNQASQNPATLALAHVNGHDATIAKAAVIWVGSAIPRTEWQPFASYSVNRNTLASSPTDVQTLNIGLAGAIGHILENKWALSSTLSISAREDRKSKTASNALLFDNYVVIWPFAQAEKFGASHGVNFYPRFGWLLDDERRVKAGNVAGTSTAYFLGMRLEYWPGPFNDRTQVTLASQRFRDSHVDAGRLQRKLAYSRLSIDYHLVDPRKEKDSWIKPIIGLDREVGADPLNAVGATNRTTFGIKLQIN